METNIAEERLIGTIVSIDELYQYDIPQDIINEMKKWDVIYKSPYGSSFYNTTDIDWNYKPDGSLRVSNHWNFSTNRTKLTGRLHCKTNKKVVNNLKYTLAKYRLKNDKYDVLVSRLTESQQRKIDYNRSNQNIDKCRAFSERITNHEIFASFIFKDEEFSGKVTKLSKTALRIVDENEVVLFNANRSTHKMKDVKNLIILDKFKQPIENPYIYEI